jgi:hypothetical protein
MRSTKSSTRFSLLPSFHPSQLNKDHSLLAVPVQLVLSCACTRETKNTHVAPIRSSASGTRQSRVGTDTEIWLSHVPWDPGSWGCAFGGLMDINILPKSPWGSTVMIKSLLLLHSDLPYSVFTYPPLGNSPHPQDRGLSEHCPDLPASVWPKSQPGPGKDTCVPLFIDTCRMASVLGSVGEPTLSRSPHGFELCDPIS